MCFGGDNLILIDALYNVTGKNTHLKVETRQDKRNGFFVPCHLLIGSQETRPFRVPQKSNGISFVYLLGSFERFLNDLLSDLFRFVAELAQWNQHADARVTLII